MNIAFDLADGIPSLNGYWLFKDENPVHIITQELFAAAAISFLCGGLYYFIVSSRTSETSLALERDLLRTEVQERRRAEQALQQEKHFTDAMLGSLPGILYLLDEQGRFLRWNETAEKVLGYSPDEITRMKALDVFGEDGKQTVSEAMQKVFVEGVASVEATFVAKDGSRLPYLFTGTRIMVGGKPCLLGAGTDISQRILAEELRRQHSEALRQTLDGIAITDLDGIIQFVNPAWAAMHGYSPEELNGKHLRVFHTPEQMAHDVNLFMGTLLEKGGHLGEVNHVTKDGVVFPTWMSATIVKDEHGAPRNMIAMARDISHQRNLEAQLGQAQKMESVGRLAGGVAHDFNNLLMAILGYAEMILTHCQELTPGAREWVGQIQKAGKRASDLTRQLLAFGRKQTLEMQALDMNEVVLGFEKMLIRLIGEDIRVQTLLNPRIGAVKADAAQIEQVLLNLAVNARDAMPNGGRLTIETADVVLDDAYVTMHPYVEPGTYVMLAVSDTGCGMDAETQKMAFEPFFTTKGPGEGTGLGLAMVYGIVRQHQGYISVYSELGHGTTFKIYLPRITQAAQEEITPSAPAAVPGGTETILVVEDDAAVRGLTCKMVANLGYDVIEADGGPHALSLAAERETIHLLLTDVIMPEMSGRRISEQVAALHPEIKTLYMSGYTASVIAHHGVLDPGVHLLQKPFTNQSLAEKIREVLAG